MTVNKIQNGSSCTLSVKGRLDTVTAPALEAEIAKITDADSLVIDFKELEYISSAGLRVLLATHKNFVKKGGLTITNTNETVNDVFEVTGFNDILVIK